MRLLSVIALVLAGCSFDPAARPPDAGALADVTVRDADSVDRSADGAPDVLDEEIPPADIGMDQGRADLPTNDVGEDVGEPDMGLPPADGATVVVDGALTLYTSLPHLVDDCMPGATPCDDLDGDTLLDTWEELVLDRFRPLLVFDEQEKLFTDPDAIVAFVGRITPTRRGDRVTMWLPILYDRDYGTCGSLSAHPGDSERVVLLLEVGADTVAMERVYTAAHENTPNDHSMTFAGPELTELEYDESLPNAARWVVYPSKNKHATYITRDVCEGVSPIPCFNEACGPDGVNRDDFLRLPDVVHVGEPDLPLFDDLGPLGFVGESAWADQDFCGGHDRNATCPGAVRTKLTTNPFQ